MLRSGNRRTHASSEKAGWPYAATPHARAPEQDLDLWRVGAAFDKAFDRVKAAIEADDGRSADVDKLHARPYHRAKWDCANRVLMRLAHVEQAASAQTVCLVIGLDAQALFEEFRGVSSGTRITAEGSSP